MGRKQAQAFFAALIAWPVAAQDYTPVLIPTQIIGSPQTMIPLNGGDDSTRLVQFAFPFEYYGQTFTQAWVSSNGFISFNNVGHLCCDGWPIENAPRNTIYGLWSDLISGGNPYYRSDATATVFGWYGTQEYGSGLSNTFEIALFPDGKVQWNYGDVNNIYHTVSAGLTGPTMADSISLFYGQNVNLLDNTSYVAGAAPPAPPPPSPISVTEPIPSVAPNPVAVVQQQVEAIAAVEEAVVEAAAEEVAAVIEEPVAEAEAAVETVETVETVEATEDAATEEVSEASEEQSETQTASAGPLPPGMSVTGSQGPSDGSEKAIVVSGRRDRNVDAFQADAIEDAALFVRETVMPVSLQTMAALVSADLQDTQTYGAQTTTEVTGEGYVIVAGDGPTFSQPIMMTTSEVSSPSNQAQQMELLNMSGMQGEMAAGQNIDVGDVNSGDNEAMTQLAAVPAGYSAYTQARIPDQPFYQPRDIYKARRIPDANVALYRMMRGQDQLWDDMVEDQYE